MKLGLSCSIVVRVGDDDDDDDDDEESMMCCETVQSRS